MHVLGIAIFDVLATVALAGGIWYMWRLSFWKVLVALFLVATALHLLFCVSTPITRALLGFK